MRIVCPPEEKRVSKSPKTGFWIVPLALAVVSFLAYAVFPYLTLDPRHSRIPPPPEHVAYYAVLVLHIACGAIAMATGTLLIWTGSSGRFIALHRILGRIYIFCGVLPASVMAVGLSAMSPFGPILITSNLTLTTLWLIATIAGYRMIRSGRVLEHRRWMLRSYVLTLSIITNRLWLPLAAMVLAPRLATTFHGDEALMWQIIPGISGWLGWVLPLMVAEWSIVDRVGPVSTAFSRQTTQAAIGLEA
ncbi:DUF2306 domain-containing protein [Terriglobus sp. ADX1]|uniref:DUF2306 domain-containing protein n=1 Tax=Terriglobus sp. ADX1 TaxID=2794063 RepID=UPI002FE6BF8F